MSGARMVVAVLSVSVATGCGIALPSGPLLERSLMPHGVYHGGLHFNDMVGQLYKVDRHKD